MSEKARRIAAVLRVCREWPMGKPYDREEFGRAADRELASGAVHG